MAQEPITTILYQTTSETSLGRVALAATMVGGGGVVPRGHLRIFGRYGLMLVTQGNGVYRDAAGAKIPLEQGSLVWVFPDWPHWYGTEKGRTWSELYVVFDGPVFDLWRSVGLLDPAKPVCRVAEPGRFAHRIEEILIGEAEPLVRLHSFLGLLAETAGAETTTDRASWVSTARLLLETDLNLERGADEVAERLGLGVETFRKRFASEVGVSPARYRRQRRLEAARELLDHTQLTHRAIALRLGFADEFTFSKRFKAEFGVSPRDVRSRRSEKSK